LVYYPPIPRNCGALNVAGYELKLGPIKLLVK